MIRVCFVCLGNICRSPTAGAIMIDLVKKAGLSEAIHVESAGTGSWHVGELADPRTRDEAQKRGIKITSRAQQFGPWDFERFDYILSVDRANFQALMTIAPHDKHRAKLHMLRRFEGIEFVNSDVPDPYYGGPEGFSDVFAMCERACQGLLAYIKERHKL